MTSMSSILDDVRKVVTGNNADEFFDTDLLLAINGHFARLTQIGAGPAEGFVVEDETTQWTDFTTKKLVMSLVKDYIILKTRLQFDPPDSSSVMQAYREQADEDFWRISISVDPAERNVFNV